MTAAPRKQSKTYKVPKVRTDETWSFRGLSGLFQALKRSFGRLTTTELLITTRKRRR